MPQPGTWSHSNHQAGEQRHFTRIRLTVKCPVEMSVRHKSPPGGWDGHITVLNERGGFVEIGGNYAMGTPVMLRFGFPLIDEVLCTGVVRHHKPGVGVGVEFLNLFETDREHLAGLVRARPEGTQQDAGPPGGH